jgi:hypothetical protein
MHTAAMTDVVDHPLVQSLSADRPVLLVCLRHLGCAFAREMLADVASQRATIEASGIRLVLAHLETDAAAQPLLRRYALADVATISDPSAHVYESCGLARGGVAQIASPRVLWRWCGAALIGRHGAGWTGADVRRLAGVFLIRGGRIVRAFRQARSGDRLDYARLCSEWLER